MITFKQLEAVFWIGKLGSFALAADKLHTSQSAISKRIQELEMTLGQALFDRSQRAAQLTEKGQELVLVAKQLLDQRTAAIEQLMDPKDVSKKLKIGVTELTAMTWLPKLVRQINDCYPLLTIEPDVDNSASLWAKVQADELDVIFVPDAFGKGDLQRTTIGKVENAWMCQPGLVPIKPKMRIRDLGDQRLIVQGPKSGTGLVYDSLVRKSGMGHGAEIVASNLFALIGFTLSGLGISYLPKHCLSPMIQKGQLEVLPISPSLPPVSYVALHKGEKRSTLLSSIVVMAQDCCDFTTMFQVPDGHQRQFINPKVSEKK